MTSMATCDFLLVPTSTDASFAMLGDALRRMWVEGADRGGGGSRRCARRDRRPCCRWHAAGRLAQLLGIGAARVPERLVVVRRWVARWLLSEVDRSLDPAEEISDRGRLLGSRSLSWCPRFRGSPRTVDAGRRRALAVAVGLSGARAGARRYPCRFRGSGPMLRPRDPGDRGGWHGDCSLGGRHHEKRYQLGVRPRGLHPDVSMGYRVEDPHRGDRCLRTLEGPPRRPACDGGVPRRPPTHDPRSVERGQQRRRVRPARHPRAVVRSASGVTGLGDDLRALLLQRRGHEPLGQQVAAGRAHRSRGAALAGQPLPGADPATPGGCSPRSARSSTTALSTQPCTGSPMPTG